MEWPHHAPAALSRLGAVPHAVCCCMGPQGAARRCLPRLWPTSPTSTSSQSRCGDCVVPVTCTFSRVVVECLRIILVCMHALAASLSHGPPQDHNFCCVFRYDPCFCHCASLPHSTFKSFVWPTGICFYRRKPTLWISHICISFLQLSTASITLTPRFTCPAADVH